MDNKIIQLNAIAFAKKRGKQIAKEFTDLNKFPADEIPISVFMAGSPGAGKTEFSKRIIELLEQEKDLQRMIRIDGDDIRNSLPGYTGNNSYLFQGAVSIVVEKIHDLILSQKQSFILDGTLSRCEKAEKNIERSLKKNRPVSIFYIYQDPKVAWHFTQERERIEGRNIPKSAFIRQFIDAKETVSHISNKYNTKVSIFLVKKNFNKNTVDEIVKINPTNRSIDEYINANYTENDLKRIL